MLRGSGGRTNPVGDATLAKDEGEEIVGGDGRLRRKYGGIENKGVMIGGLHKTALYATRAAREPYLAGLRD